MSSPLHMIRLRPDPAKLIAFAHNAGTIDAASATGRRGKSPPGDYGYPLHQLLAGVFGDAAPKPFLHELTPKASRSARKRQGDLLAYSPHDEAALHDYAALQRANAPGWEQMSAALGLSALEARAMPAEWRPGRRYRFEVRCRPVQRISRAKARGLPRERDVFLAAIDGLPVEKVVDRAQVYLDWLTAEFARNEGAELVDARIAAMKRTALLRRTQSGGGNGRPARTFDGPDVTFSGTLAVTDSDAFNRLLARGLGRHRAFGFGMLLLAPGG